MSYFYSSDVTSLPFLLVLMIDDYVNTARDNIMIVKQTTGPPKGFLGKLLGFTWANKVFTLGQVWLKQEKDVSVKVTNMYSSHYYHYYCMYALMMRS